MIFNGEKRKIKADETRRKIYECAEQIFLTNDYKEVSVDSIVKMAKVQREHFMFILLQRMQ
jgi:AcrR family transcriptional regulator